MKTYIRFIAFIIGAMLFASCNSQLDLDSDGHINMSSVFLKRNTTIGYLTTCYQYCAGLDLSSSSFTDNQSRESI
jgi:hypothetical protein